MLNHCYNLNSLITPGNAWHQISIFEWKKSKYLNYYSHYIEITRLSTATSSDVITHIKSLFACHGVPESITSDNGAQYVSDHASLKALPRSMALHILLAAHDIPKGMGLQRGQ